MLVSARLCPCVSLSVVSSVVSVVSSVVSVVSGVYVMCACPGVLGLGLLVRLMSRQWLCAGVYRLVFVGRKS